MRLLISIFLACFAGMAREPQVYFSVIGSEAGAWPELLSSIGLARQDSDLARVFVLRAGTPASPQWARRVERGVILILEGDSPVAQSFGFHRGADGVQIGSIVDARRPKLPIVWQNAIEAPR